MHGDSPVPGTAPVGAFVTVERVLLEAGQRAANLPADTAMTPLVAHINGFATEPAQVGRDVDVVTLSGRTVRGVAVNLYPAHTHGFGGPDPEILAIAPRVRAWLDMQAGVK
ncbi:MULTISPECIES: 2-amino-4-oxopentanoate thiolase subunit OrtA [unclassified Mycolicibacterium]|uniref:2-amino-4-oxopentanoate thiolase subunit OrtA n=1 Tax=unclassified Mycolicibacterium TaxID=2636767 RepID=UPI0012DFE60A|nr:MULTISPECIES: 2-amino-4-oxopentanoate thiolase subunit OrtA [unclassified Mycolicibacterium]MUL81358.1 hypothetical protein [Mycolicibacterium sp. CBMA 329]MUL87124.1 hypothetical protein [Mycolicibacterium sp. CBMA 331]MUL98594.1 hypothetical protein [Mycolicibacterium sp. CBMA 334]MUM28329.1 hypothetical protein [Mycolicibacterium sp. CBMA 295]MUM37421.1 hypothetical protein [Mycolicibacterium sp. CBMA 247]